jgi:hypothetical protein
MWICQRPRYLICQSGDGSVGVYWFFGQFNIPNFVPAERTYDWSLLTRNAASSSAFSSIARGGANQAFLS